MRLDKRVAIVMGGGDFIGHGVAVRLAEEGAKVAIVDVNKEKMDATHEVLKKVGREAVTIEANMTSREQVKNSVNETLKRFNRIDILVNAAQRHKFEKAEKIPEEMWNHEIDLNLKGSFLSIQAVIGPMKDQRYGKIVNMSSTAKDGVPWFSHRGHSSFAAARGGIIGLTRSLAYELGRYNITINCVVQGPIENPRTRTLFNSLKKDPEVEVFPTKMMALQRFGTPEDVANAVLFLSSDESSYITGQSLYVSGGLYGV